MHAGFNSVYEGALVDYAVGGKPPTGLCREKQIVKWVKVDGERAGKAIDYSQDSTCGSCMFLDPCVAALSHINEITVSSSADEVGMHCKETRMIALDPSSRVRTLIQYHNVR